MRGILIYVCSFLLVMSLASALPVEDVTLTTYVNDYTNTLSASQVQEISSIAQSLKEQGVAELAVVIVDDFDGLSKEEYAIAIAHEKLGDTQVDNGLLLLVGLDVREYRIEVGYGLEGVLNDAKVGRMARELLVPNFQAGNYGQGIKVLIQAIGFELLPDGIPAPQGYASSNESSGISLWFLFILLFFIIRAISYAQYKKKHYNDPKDKEIADAFTAAAVASWFFRPPRGGSGGFGGGGFGGGGFGGGGAGGGW